jgi:hypothetical protein
LWIRKISKKQGSDRVGGGQDTNHPKKNGVYFLGLRAGILMERHYVAIPNMEVWYCLPRLAPDVPDGWSFPDVVHEPCRQ